MDDVLRPLGLTTAQYSVLSALEAEPGMSNARLARSAFVSAQAMQGVLANLERDGRLVRTADPANGRVLRAQLTPEGAARLARAHDAVRVVEEVLVGSFGQPEAAELATSLTRCAENLAEAGRPSAGGPALA